MTATQGKRRRLTTAGAYGGFARCVIRVNQVFLYEKSCCHALLAFAVREKDDLAKLAFMNAACEKACPFRKHGLIPAEIGSCLDWKATRSSVQVCCVALFFGVRKIQK